MLKADVIKFRERVFEALAAEVTKQLDGKKPVKLKDDREGGLLEVHAAACNHLASQANFPVPTT